MHQLMRDFTLAAVHAVLFALAFPPFDLWFLAIFVPLPLAWLAIRTESTKRALAIVFATQFVMWLWLNKWIIPVTIVGYPCLSLYMSVYAVIFVWFMHRISNHSTFARWPTTVLLPIVWVGLEFLRGEIAFDGYPWFLLAHPVIDVTTIVQSADVFGTYFISFLVAIASGTIIDGLRVRFGLLNKTTFSCCTSVAGLTLLLSAYYGVNQKQRIDVTSPGPTVLVIQTNLPQSNKTEWTIEQQVTDFASFVSLTQREYQQATDAGHDIDLIVWPETMLPGFGLEPETLSYLKSGNYSPGDIFASGITSLHEKLDTPVLVGSLSFPGLRVEDDRWVWDEHFNSAYLIKNNPPYQRYDKVALTPFGETMPYISNWKWLEEKLLALGAKGMSFDLDRGRINNRLKFSWNGEEITIATPICFEDTVASLCRKMVYQDGNKQSNFLVNLSNDGWFGSSDADRKLHAMIARYRCIENRVEMIRCVNTGYSVSIDSSGNLLGAVGGTGYGEAKQEGGFVAEVRFDSRESLYGRIGNVFAWFTLAILAGMVGWTFFKGSTEK